MPRSRSRIRALPLSSDLKDKQTRGQKCPVVSGQNCPNQGTFLGQTRGQKCPVVLIGVERRRKTAAAAPPLLLLANKPNQKKAQRRYDSPFKGRLSLRPSRAPCCR